MSSGTTPASDASILDRLGYTADMVEPLNGIYVSGAQSAGNAPSDEVPLIDGTSSNCPTFTITAFDSPWETNAMQIDVTITSPSQALDDFQNKNLEAARFTVQDTLRKTAKAWDKVSIQNYARQSLESDTAALEYHLKEVAYMTLRDWPECRKYAQSGIRVDASGVTFPEYLGELVYSHSFPPQQVQDGWRGPGEVQ